MAAVQPLLAVDAFLVRLRNVEQDPVDPIGSITGQLHIAFSGTLPFTSADHVERQAMPCHITESYSDCRWCTPGIAQAPRQHVGALREIQKSVFQQPTP